jgi:hypothetical protein
VLITFVTSVQVTNYPLKKERQIMIKSNKNLEILQQKKTIETEIASPAKSEGKPVYIANLRDRIEITFTLSEGCNAPSAVSCSSGIGTGTMPSSQDTASRASRSSESVKVIS